MDNLPYTSGMTLLYKGIVSYGNYPGGPGANVLWFSQGTPPITTDEMAQALNDELASLYDDLKTFILTGVTITIPSEFVVVEDNTGDVVDTVVAGTPAGNITGTGTGAQLPRSTAACVRFNTDLFRNSKRLQGRSFIGPMSSGAFDTNGMIGADTRNQIDTAYQALISGVGPRLAIFHRPSSSAAADGYYADVVNVRTLLPPTNVHSRRQ